MGGDANVKWKRSEQRRRLVIIGSLIGLSVLCLIVATFTSPHPTTTMTTPRMGVQKIAKNDGEQSQVVATSSSSSSLDVVKNAVAATASPTTTKSHSLREQKNKKDALVDNDEGGESQRRRRKNNNNDVNDAPPRLDDDESKRDEREVAADRAFLEAQVRTIKSTGIIMETDPTALALTRKLQDVTRELITLRYPNPSNNNNNNNTDYNNIKNYRIELQLEFQPSIPDYSTKGKDGSIVVELAPISLLPCSVYNFLEIARTWKSGAFHRNANHVLQATAHSTAITSAMPFQEYSPSYPHKRGTLGYCGRPSGPCFYVSIMDNTVNHGPGSQQKHNPYEADSIIGTVIKGMEEDGTVSRIHGMPGHEFLSNKDDWVLIKTMRILVPSSSLSSSEAEGNEDGYVEFSKSP